VFGVSELLGYWVTGLLGYWVIGLLGYWVTGLLGYWVTKLLSCGEIFNINNSKSKTELAFNPAIY
jgi:hypothetical protein